MKSLLYQYIQMVIALTIASQECPLFGTVIRFYEKKTILFVFMKKRQYQIAFKAFNISFITLQIITIYSLE